MNVIIIYVYLFCSMQRFGNYSLRTCAATQNELDNYHVDTTLTDAHLVVHFVNKLVANLVRMLHIFLSIKCVINKIRFNHLII